MANWLLARELRGRWEKHERDQSDTHHALLPVTRREAPAVLLRKFVVVGRKATNMITPIPPIITYYAHIVAILIAWFVVFGLLPFCCYRHTEDVTF